MKLGHALLFRIPAALMGGSFIALAAYFGTVWPWGEILHGGEERTLFGTLFHFEHGVRQLPLDILLGMAVGGATLRWFPPRWFLGGPEIGRRWLWVLGAGIGAIVLTVGCSLLAVGADTTAAAFTQRIVRSDWPHRWGFHWNHHLQSQGLLFLWAFALVGFYRQNTGRPQVKRARGKLYVYLLAWGTFIGLTIFFVPRRSAFLDPVRLAHQLREFLVHAVGTVPLAIGAALYVADPPRSPLGKTRGAWLEPAILIPAAAVLVAIVPMAVSALQGDPLAHESSRSLTLYVAGHVLHHLSSFIVVPIVAALAYELGRPTVLFHVSKQLEHRKPRSFLARRRTRRRRMTEV